MPRLRPLHIGTETLPDGTKVFVKEGVFVAAPDALTQATGWQPRRCSRA